MYQKIEMQAANLLPFLETIRMQLHRHPETAWEEIQTSNLVSAYLADWGFEVIQGTSVSGRATGVIGILPCGPGPVIGLRFDLDALPLQEAHTSAHRPFTLGFSSIIEGKMHACGHDGHTAIGLGCARLLSRMRAHLHGTVKLIFQPAEEGARGAQPIVERGWLDDVDYFLAGHIFNRPDTISPTCNVISGVGSSLATTKLNLTFHGKKAHAAHRGQGIDVIPAMAETVLAFCQADSPEGFIHTGIMQSGSGRNIVADLGTLEVETRALTTQKNQELMDLIQKTLCRMENRYGVRCQSIISGSAPCVESSPEFSQMLEHLFAKKTRGLHPAHGLLHFPASEDVSHMMNRVKEHGGMAAFLLFPTELSADLHHSDFDFPMELLSTGVTAFTCAVYALSAASSDECQ